MPGTDLNTTWQHQQAGRADGWLELPNLLPPRHHQWPWRKNLVVASFSSSSPRLTTVVWVSVPPKKWKLLQSRWMSLNQPQPLRQRLQQRWPRQHSKGQQRRAPPNARHVPPGAARWHSTQRQQRLAMPPRHAPVRPHLQMQTPATARPRRRAPRALPDTAAARSRQRARCARASTAPAWGAAPLAARAPAAPRRGCALQPWILTRAPLEVRGRAGAAACSRVLPHAPLVCSVCWRWFCCVASCAW